MDEGLSDGTCDGLMDTEGLDEGLLDGTSLGATDFEGLPDGARLREGWCDSVGLSLGPSDGRLEGIPPVS